MKQVIWVTDVTETWSLSHHYSLLLEDITAFSLNESLCPETVKYMAKRLRDTPYNRAFRHKYSIYQDEYKSLVEKFNTQAGKNGKIEVK